VFSSQGHHFSLAQIKLSILCPFRAALVQLITNIIRALPLDLAEEENLDNNTAFGIKINIDIYEDFSNYGGYGIDMSNIIGWSQLITVLLKGPIHHFKVAILSNMVHNIITVWTVES